MRLISSVLFSYFCFEFLLTSFQIDISDILNILGKAATNDSDLANMTGLLGNNDGNADNDLLSRTGILYKASSTEEQLWDFGTSCKILLLYLY